MKVYGLTGGVGMGKSTSGKLLRQSGIPIVETDLIARQLVEPGEAALEEIQKVFGVGFVGMDGRLRRDELARRVFGDAEARKCLEEILHPRIRSIWQEQIQGWRREGRALAVVDIPLLFETNASDNFDAVICVACSSFSQQIRLLARGWNPDQIPQRIAAQWPIEKKMELADYVVWTDGDLDTHEEQIKRIVR